jgi:UDP-2,3-diacylglucosamine pyrophosphatase LpxH
MPPQPARAESSGESDNGLERYVARRVVEEACVTRPSGHRAGAVKVVVSDLHLSDGDPLRETWGAAQQAAWGRLLSRLTCGDTSSDPVELIINGDCFDFLTVAPPLEDQDETNSTVGLEKLERIIAAHADWYARLYEFLQTHRRTVTFLLGNHDVELAFAPVRARVREALAAPPASVRFCLRRAYRAAPDVEIEHGCQVDPWNRIVGLWDDNGDSVTASPRELEAETAPSSDDPGALQLPFGSRYYYRVFAPIQRRFPYCEAFVPSLPEVGVLALVCLYAPDLIVSGAERSRALFANGLAPFGSEAELQAAARRGAADLYLAVMPGVAALQAQVWERAGAVMNREEAERTVAYVAAIHAGLAQDERTALHAIFSVPQPNDAQSAALDAVAAAAMGGRSAALRVALCGHTHVEDRRRYPVPHASTIDLVNTGSWYPRLALPMPEALDENMIAWLRAPRTAPRATRDAAAFTFALLRAEPEQPTVVELHQVGRDGW